MLAQLSARNSKRGASTAAMQDLATLLADVISYLNAGWRSHSRSLRWLVRGVVVALVVGLAWVLRQM